MDLTQLLSPRTSLPGALLIALASSACGKEEPAAKSAPAVEQAAPAAPAAPAQPEPPAAPAPEVAAFDAQQTFTTICAACHGQTGGGDGPAGVALNPKPASFNAAEFWASRDRDHIIKVIKGGGPAVGKSPLMAAYGAQFDDEQIGQLADYVLTFKPAS